MNSYYPKAFKKEYILMETGELIGYDLDKTKLTEFIIKHIGKRYKHDTTNKKFWIIHQYGCYKDEQYKLW